MHLGFVGLLGPWHCYSRSVSAPTPMGTLHRDGQREYFCCLQNTRGYRGSQVGFMFHRRFWVSFEGSFASILGQYSTLRQRAPFNNAVVNMIVHQDLAYPFCPVHLLSWAAKGNAPVSEVGCGCHCSAQARSSWTSTDRHGWGSSLHCNCGCWWSCKS